MSDTRRLVALIIAVTAFGVLVFGVARGVSASGPASGTRLIVSVAPPRDDAAIAQCVEVARTQMGSSGRVIGGADGLVVEIATQDPKEVAAATATLEADGAHHRMHVERTIAFTRATGFVGRGWPFFAIAAVMLAGGALLWRRR